VVGAQAEDLPEGSAACYRLVLIMQNASLSLLAALLCAATPALARTPLHTWTDRDGVVHVDDFGAPPQRSARRSPRAAAASAPASKPRAERWWERRSDAPPDEIDRAARLYNIPAELVRAVIAVESAGDAGAVSNRGALGLMQLMPGTASEMYVSDPVDPAQNILGGTRYLRSLANQFRGDMMLMLAAYNAGPEAVRKFHGVPPFDETRQYVRKVMARYYDLKKQGQGKERLASAAVEPKP